MCLHSNIVIVDSRIGQTNLTSLQKLNRKTILVPLNKSLYNAVAGHPDMQVFILDNKNILVSPDANISVANELRSLGVNVIIGQTKLIDKYPYNIAYNAAKVGKFVFHNFSYTDPTLIQEIEKRNLKKIPVKQGYTKCSICIVNENSIITADTGIYKAASENGIEVLLIPPEKGILLKGLDYGFIGGSTGLIEENKLAFLGDAQELFSYNEILKFTKERDVEIISLSKNEVEDFGSILSL